MRKDYLIKTYIDIYKTSYKEGELENVNGWKHRGFITAESPKEALNIFIENELYFDNVDIYQDDEVGIYADVLVDEDNNQAGANAVERWKKGEITLYNANILFRIHELKEIKSI